MVHVLKRQVADDRQLIRDFGLQWQQLANVHPLHARPNWLEGAANLGGRVGFKIIHVDVAGTAFEPDHDDRLGRFARAVWPRA